MYATDDDDIGIRLTAFSPSPSESPVYPLRRGKFRALIIVGKQDRVLFRLELLNRAT
ncbi:MAG: hypothetical protein CM1200mP36_01130 [Gammaproteobacteria bacterium]|nr:MAG: hypothetical protein CM1200mP36_01130 [Gammaproteobacteria bacterium]